MLYGRGHERIWLPAFEVTAVDETGAGDAFIGHLMAAWFEDMPVRDRLLRASAAGALAIPEGRRELVLPQMRTDSLKG